MSKLKTHGTLGSESVFSPQAAGANCGSIDAPTTWPLPFLECEWVANGTSVPYVIIWVFEEHQVESLVATDDVRRFDLPALNHVNQIGWCFETYTGRHRFTTRRRGCGLRAMWLQRGHSNLPQSLQDPFVLNEPSEASPFLWRPSLGGPTRSPKMSILLPWCCWSMEPPRLKAGQPFRLLTDYSVKGGTLAEHGSAGWHGVRIFHLAPLSGWFILKNLRSHWGLLIWHLAIGVSLFAIPWSPHAGDENQVAITYKDLPKECLEQCDTASIGWNWLNPQLGQFEY